MVSSDLNILLAGDIRLRLVVKPMIGRVEIRKIENAHEQRHGQERAQYKANDSFGREIHLRERLAQAPLPAGASVERGVGVVATENHRNLAAGRGCSGAPCSAFLLGSICAVNNGVFFTS